MPSPHSIGAHEFINLRGQPQKLAMEVEAITRPNIDGTAIRKLGQRGQPFRLVSAVDVLDIQSGRFLFSTYLALLNSAPVALKWNNHNFAAVEGWNVGVLGIDLQLLEVREKIVGGLGGPTYKAWLEAVWTLVFVIP